MFANVLPASRSKDRLVSARLFGQASDAAFEKLAPYRPRGQCEILEFIPEGPREAFFTMPTRLAVSLLYTVLSKHSRHVKAQSSYLRPHTSPATLDSHYVDMT